MVRKSAWMAKQRPDTKIGREAHIAQGCFLAVLSGLKGNPRTSLVVSKCVVFLSTGGCS